MISIFETIFALIAVVLLLALPIAALVLLIVAFVRTQRIGQIERRLQQLEGQFKPPPAAAPPPLSDAPPILAAEIMAPAAPAEILAISAEPLAGAMEPARPASREAPGATLRAWEGMLGRSVLGWVALVALVLASATFLKYAFENAWIGPQGQLSIILAGGLFVLWQGFRHAQKGWRLFAQMLLSAGLVVIYLGTYATFGFYHVVSQPVGMTVLVVIVVEAALLALAYEAWAVALVALLGGLATPLLISSPYDQYWNLFAYLGVLNGGTLLILWRRPWPALGTIALVGAQGLFCLWYEQYFHPEKLAWAIGFQALLWALHLGYHAFTFVGGRRQARLEDLVRLLLGAILGFAQVYNLLTPEYAPWMGTLAVLLAVVYAGVAHAAFRARPEEEAGLFTLLAVVLGGVGIAIPLEAEANWISLGWAIMGAALWWFGIRVERGALRGMGTAFGLLAVLRLLTIDALRELPDNFWPVWNEFALPAVGVVVCLLGSVMFTWRRSRRLAPVERGGTLVAGIAGVVLLGWVLSGDLFHWFATQARLTGDRDWLWAGQVAVSMGWGVYASILLGIGFRAQRPVARWLALGLFALTALKVFFVDLASVGELQRILALFVLAILMGGAA